MLAAKADVNAKANDGYTALFMALSQSHREIAKALLAANADVNAKTNTGLTVLWNVGERDLDMLQAFIAAKVDLNAKDASGETALMNASQYGHLAVVRALLAANADVNAKTNTGETALMQASRNGHMEVVRALIAAKADVNAKDDSGETALFLASERRFADIAQLLGGSLPPEEPPKKAVTTKAPSILSLVKQSNGEITILGGIPLVVEDFSYDAKLRRAAPSGGQIYGNTIIDLTKLSGGISFSVFDINFEKILPSCYLSKGFGLVSMSAGILLTITTLSSPTTYEQ